MVTELLNSQVALPAGGIAGAFAVIFVTLMKLRVTQKENDNNWAKEHMDRLTKERDDADKRADLFLERLDRERELRIQAQKSVGRLEGISEALRDRVNQLEQEALRTQAAHSGHIES